VATTILLARHGETDWNAERRWQGHVDRPLNELGREQAESLADALEGESIAAIYSSDLLRAHETARIVGARLGIEVVVDPALREMDVGSWSGLTNDEIQDRFPEQFERWSPGEHPPHDGETRDELRARVLAAVERIATAASCVPCSARSPTRTGCDGSPTATWPESPSRTAGSRR
jgi:probable phosphoglycerate mutase